MKKVNPMASPFPGMDPYLEGDLWPDVHHALASQIRNRTRLSEDDHMITMHYSQVISPPPSNQLPNVHLNIPADFVQG